MVALGTRAAVTDYIVGHTSVLDHVRDINPSQVVILRIGEPGLVDQ